MNHGILYPKPPIEVIEKFKTKFGESHYGSAPKMIVSDCSRLAINKEPVLVSVVKGAEDVIRGLKIAKYLFSARVSTKGLTKYSYVKIGENLYDTKLFVQGLRLVRKNSKTPVDFWKLTNEKEPNFILGLGATNGFVLIACYEDTTNDYIDIEQIVQKVKPKVIQLETPIPNQIKLDDELIEKWIKELGI